MQIANFTFTQQKIKMTKSEKMSIYLSKYQNILMYSKQAESKIPEIENNLYELWGTMEYVLFYWKISMGVAFPVPTLVQVPWRLSH